MKQYTPRDRFFVQYDGHKINLHLACQQARVPYHAAYRRVKSGSTPQEAFDSLLPGVGREATGNE